MSSTNRGAQRSPADFYRTPSWCVHRFLEAVDLPSGNWLEPCAGDGAIIRAARMPGVRWTAWELRRRAEAQLRDVVPSSRLFIGDFVAAVQRGEVRRRRFAVAITNPPYRLAQEFIEACMEVADTVAMLLRLNYLGSEKRSDFMRLRCPDVFVLPNRVSFTGDGNQDSTEYGWMVWRARRTTGRITVLASTSPAERSRRA